MLSWLWHFWFAVLGGRIIESWWLLRLSFLICLLLWFVGCLICRGVLTRLWRWAVVLQPCYSGIFQCRASTWARILDILAGFFWNRGWFWQIRAFLFPFLLAFVQYSCPSSGALGSYYYWWVRSFLGSCCGGIRLYLGSWFGGLAKFRKSVGGAFYAICLWWLSVGVVWLGSDFASPSWKHHMRIGRLRSRKFLAWTCQDGLLGHYSNASCFYSALFFWLDTMELFPLFLQSVRKRFKLGQDLCSYTWFTFCSGVRDHCHSFLIKAELWSTV